MICNRADLDAAIDWLAAGDGPFASGFSNDLEVRQYRSFYIWRPRTSPYYLLDWSGFMVAPWVVDDSW